MRRDVVGLGIALALASLAHTACRAPSDEHLPSHVSTVSAVAEPPRPAAPRMVARTAAGGRVSERATAADIASHVRTAAARHRVPESLVAAVISVESQFNPRAISRRGARGLMQLMPETAAGLGVRNAFDPKENVDAGARHLRDLLNRFENDLPLALAAYNAGAQAVIDHRGVPPYPETRAFVARVLGRLERGAVPITLAGGSPRRVVRVAARVTPDHARPESEPIVEVAFRPDEREPEPPPPVRAARPADVPASAPPSARVEAP